MAISGQYKSNINQSDDSVDYEVGFNRDALFLIIAGHKRLTENAADYSNEEEPNITGELVHYTREYIEAPDACEWAYQYAVHDDPPENNAIRMGKRRKKVDIIVERTQKGRHPRMRFEAKRLKRPGFYVGKYVGKEGLGEFIAGNYAAVDDTAGMLGYIQSDDCDYWARKISDDMRKKKKEVGLIKSGQWQKAHLDNIDQCYQTRHNRPTIKRELLVYHLLLVFVRRHEQATN
jgi:hypothetical protein